MVSKFSRFIDGILERRVCIWCCIAGHKFNEYYAKIDGCQVGTIFVCQRCGHIVSYDVRIMSRTTGS